MKRNRNLNKKCTRFLKKKKVPRKKVSEINCLLYGQIHSYVKHKQENSDGWINNHANYIPDFLFKKKPQFIRYSQVSHSDIHNYNTRNRKMTSSLLKKDFFQQIISWYRNTHPQLTSSTHKIP